MELHGTTFRVHRYSLCRRLGQSDIDDEFDDGNNVDENGYGNYDGDKDYGSNEKLYLTRPLN